MRLEFEVVDSLLIGVESIMWGQQAPVRLFCLIELEIL
jgi:hypothetical protein